MAKGGSTSQESNLPKFVETGLQQSIGMGRDVSQMGYTPYYGPDVAAFSPMQQAAFEGTNQMAGAFGMPTAQGQYMPEPTTYDGGVQGYSSAPMFEQAQQALQESAPGQYDYLNSFSIDPMTGQPGSRAASQQQVALEMTKPSSGGK
tara:strand:- start:298 stop:738 length:441 start_codon:yes stop_codon:yes gene_type:complete